MWVYKIRYWCDSDVHNSEGLVADETIEDCYRRLERYYGNDIVELIIHALDSSEGVLDFELAKCGLKYENFVEKES